jgi:8-oxo-dGTP pyrophosphatase MutT (NUDIX family)
VRPYHSCMNRALAVDHPDAGGVPPLLRALAGVLERWAAGYREPRARSNRRAAAVLALFYQKGGELHLAFFRRTERVTTHKGQVAFPGGSADPGDASMLDTALREAHEELGVDSSRVVILGSMQAFDTFVSNFVVTPFVGYYLDPDPVFVPTVYEVAELQEVRLGALRDPKNRRVGRVPGFNVPIPLPYYKVGDCVIWGASGGIVAELLKALDEAESEMGASA